MVHPGHMVLIARSYSRNSKFLSTVFKVHMHMAHMYHTHVCTPPYSTHIPDPSHTTAQLICLQLAVHHPITAHSMPGTALHWLLVLEPGVAPPEINCNKRSRTRVRASPGRDRIRRSPGPWGFGHRPAIPLGLWGPPPPSVWREKLLRDAPEGSRAAPGQLGQWPRGLIRGCVDGVLELPLTFSGQWEA